MSESEITFSIRNVLVLQLLTLVVARNSAFQLYQKLLRTWKSLKGLLLARKPSGRENKGKFWEIDMTKFEP